VVEQLISDLNRFASETSSRPKLPTATVAGLDFLHGVRALGAVYPSSEADLILSAIDHMWTNVLMVEHLLVTGIAVWSVALCLRRCYIRDALS